MPSCAASMPLLKPRGEGGRRRKFSASMQCSQLQCCTEDLAVLRLSVSRFSSAFAF